MKSVASADELTLERVFVSLPSKPHARRVALVVMYRDAVNFEVQRLAGRLASGYQVFHNLLLAVDHDPVTRQLLQIEPVAAAREVQVETSMRQALPHHAGADASLVQDVHALVLEYTSPDTVFDVVPALRFQHNAFNAVLMQQMS
jgi:hypothetical protein